MSKWMDKLSRIRGIQACDKGAYLCTHQISPWIRYIMEMKYNVMDLGVTGPTRHSEVVNVIMVEVTTWMLVGFIVVLQRKISGIYVI